MENAHLRVYRYTTSSDTPIFYMDYIDKSHYVIVCPTHIHTKSIPQGIPVSTNSMFHGAHELMLNPTQPDSYPMGISMEIPMNLGISHGNFPWISHAYLQLVDPLFFMECHGKLLRSPPCRQWCVLVYGDGMTEAAAVPPWIKDIKRGKWKRTVCITIYNWL
jgi:hypothetical protein